VVLPRVGQRVRVPNHFVGEHRHVAHRAHGIDGAAGLEQALETLLVAGTARSTREETGGRPRTIWEAVS
jgi:hypothetical protein